jgi:hypothetical protein
VTPTTACVGGINDRRSSTRTSCDTPSLGSCEPSLSLCLAPNLDIHLYSSEPPLLSTFVLGKLWDSSAPRPQLLFAGTKNISSGGPGVGEEPWARILVLEWRPVAFVPRSSVLLFSYSKRGQHLQWGKYGQRGGGNTFHRLLRSLALTSRLRGQPWANC